MVSVSGDSGPAIAILDGAAKAIPFFPTKAVPTGEESATPPSPATAKPFGFACAMGEFTIIDLLLRYWIPPSCHLLQTGLSWIRQNCSQMDLLLYL